MQRYLGLAGHFRRFIPYFSVISAVLSDLLKKNAKFTLTTKCEDAFIDLQSIFAARLILRPPNYNLRDAKTLAAEDVRDDRLSSC